jgi:hypothetical protein
MIDVPMRIVRYTTTDAIVPGSRWRSMITAVRRADRAHRLDVGLVLQRQHVAAHQPREGRHAEHRDRDGSR